MLIVDDDNDVHQSTGFALANTEVLGRPLEFLHAYSAADAIRILSEQTQIAVILLDVVMESDDAGLQLVRRIRQELGNSEARIILRTGQPGYAPEMDAIRDYDINDYKTKSELTRNRLYTALTAAIRSYEQIHTINASRRGLGMVIRASSQLLARQGVSEFAAGIITQICGLFGLPPEGVVCAYDQADQPGRALIVAAAGSLTELHQPAPRHPARQPALPRPQRRPCASAATTTATIRPRCSSPASTTTTWPPTCKPKSPWASSTDNCLRCSAATSSSPSTTSSCSPSSRITPTTTSCCTSPTAWRFDPGPRPCAGRPAAQRPPWR